MTPAIQSLREKLQPIFDEINSKYDFPAAAMVEIAGLEPDRDQAEIDRLSRWAEFGP